MGDVRDSWADDEADCQTSSQKLSHNVKANDVELDQAGPSEQVSRNTNEAYMTPVLVMKQTARTQGNCNHLVT